MQRGDAASYQTPKRHHKPIESEWNSTWVSPNTKTGTAVSMHAEALWAEMSSSTQNDSIPEPDSPLAVQYKAAGWLADLVEREHLDLNQREITNHATPLQLRLAFAHLVKTYDSRAEMCLNGYLLRTDILRCLSDDFAFATTTQDITASFDLLCSQCKASDPKLLLYGRTHHFVTVYLEPFARTF